MLAQGRGRWADSQTHIMIQKKNLCSEVVLKALRQASHVTDNLLMAANTTITINCLQIH